MSVEELPRVDAYIAERIRTLMSMRGLSQAALGARVPVHPSVVNLWANGRRPVPWYKLDAVASALRVTVDDLTGGQPVQQRSQIPDRDKAPTPPPQTPDQRLAEAAMTPRREAGLWEAYCFLCGRGLGPNGTLQVVRFVPTVHDCRYCMGGRLFVREVFMRPPEGFRYVAEMDDGERAARAA